MPTNARLSVGVGLVCVAMAGVLGRRIASIDVQLKAYETEKVPVSRFVTESFGSYRPEGWPLLTRLRFHVAALYLFAIVGVCLLMYGCPDVVRESTSPVAESAR
jgi:hypothetical protein